MSKQDNINNLASEIKQKGAKKIMIQLPEGLKINSTKIIEDMKDAGIECLFASDTSFGACDLRDREAKEMNCDLLVHVGHNKFYRDFDVDVPVLYFPWIIDVNIGEIDLSVIKENRIGLVTNIQHLHLLEDVKKSLEKNGKTAVVGGQILGCWTSNAVKIENSVDAFLFVGSGVFHSLALKTDKHVYGLDLEQQKIETVDLSLIEKRRYAHIFNARDARTFAVLVSSKSGQNQLIGNACKVKKFLEEKDKKAFIIVMDEITDKKLLGIRTDAYINTACPRLLDDSWAKPFINANDVEKIFE
jgi:2-(3-amino-3-carboxypropyl)histidine synthase